MNLKPCPFCGGEAVLETDHDTIQPVAPIYWKRVRCNKCNIRTTWRKSEAEAIEAWNRRVVTDTNDGSKERPAKVINQDHIENYVFGTCSFCGAPVIMHDKYCSECGAKLDWSDDE